VTVLAIDQGTSATKAMVVDDAGVPIAVAEFPVSVHSAAHGAVEVDPEQLWESVISAARTAWAEAGSPSLDAVGLANQGETILAWDRATGAPHGPAIVWQDRRAGGVCDELRYHEPWLADHTGLQLDPYFVAPKIAWLMRQPATRRGDVIATTDAWLLQRLCGSFTTDVATAGRSLLVDLDTMMWSEPAGELFGIDVSLLPSIVANDAPVGATDLLTGTPVPVSGTCVDQQAALFAEGCRTAGSVKCTFGTGAFLLANTGSHPTRSTNGLVSCPAWQLGTGRAWCLDGQVFTVGAAVSWLQAMGVIAAASDLDHLGGDIPDAGGVTFVPALAGLAAPYWRADARAAFTGLSLSTERGHLVRAAIDGICAQVAVLAQAAASDLGSPLTVLRVDGGLTRSDTLLQVQADLLQCPVEVYPSPHATALGVAEMAQLGAGGEAWPKADGAPRVVEPSISAAQATDRLAAWQHVVTVTMDL
jgi:glycerol kinase